MSKFAGAAVQLVIEPAVRDFALAALVEQAAHGFELLDGRYVGPLLLSQAAVAGRSYRADEAGAQPTAQSERIKA